MKIFNSNWKRESCPICKTKKEGKVALLPIRGTQVGYNAKAKQVHIECLELWLDEDKNLIYQIYTT